MRNILIILALFVCTSICLGQRTIRITGDNSDENGFCGHVFGNGVAGSGRSTGLGKVDKAPSNNTVNITTGATNIGNVYGAYMNDDSEYTNGTSISGPMTGNKVNVYDINHGCGDFGNNDIYGACSEKITAVEVNNNTVEISGGYNIKDVYGGRTEKGTVSSNTVTIGVVEGVTIGGEVYGGYIEKEGTVTENKVNLTSVIVTLDVFGARIRENGLASSNTVTIKGGRVVQDVYGARIGGDGLASSNTVTITSGAVDLNVYGGYISQKGTATLNTVTITSGAVWKVFGGYIQQEGTATLNEVHLTSVTVEHDVYGARIGYDNNIGKDGLGLVSSNTVTIKGGKITGNVYGGYIEEKGTVSSNTVTIGGVTIEEIDWRKSGSVFGGYASSGTVSSNTVTITSGAVHAVLGGYIAEKGTATLNEVHLTSVTVSSNVYGARIEKDGLVSSNTVTITSGTVRAVYGGYIDQKGTVSSNTVTIGGVTIEEVYGRKSGSVFGGYAKSGTVSSNTVTITTGTIVTSFVYGGYVKNGDAIDNRVTLISGTVRQSIFGGYVDEKGNAMYNTVTINGGEIEVSVCGGCVDENGTATLNTVTINGGKIERGVVGGFIGQNGTATLNTVTINGGKIEKFVFGGFIGRNGQNGTATLNTVTINDGKIEGNVCGGLVVTTGTVSSNTVTITGGKIEGNVFGGYVGGNGKAIYNTITITGTEQSFPEFSTTTILCGGICADADTNDAFTGNTLNIETKGIVVNGISNFENYKFHLKDIKPGETILTATSGGCSLLDLDLDKKLEYTPACKVDLSSSNIHLRTQSVLNKGEYCTLIKSPKGFKDNIACKQFSFDNGGLVEYSWEIEIADNKQDLIATLKRKELREEEAKPLLEGNVTGMVCINNGMDCIISKMEETESLLGEGAKLQRKGEIGAFYGLLANKSSYDDTGSHIDMTGMSMMGGIGIRVEVGEKEPSSREQSSKELSSKKLSFKELISELSFKGLSSELTAGVFGEYGTGNSDIDSGLCSCEKKSEGKSKYVGGGLLGRYNVCENEFRGTKLYLEAILRAGQVSNTFNIKEAKDGAEKECKYNDETTTYGGCALGGGYKHKVGEKIDVDWSLRYMFGYQDGKDIEKPVDAYGNKVKLESVTSSRIRVGVRGKYVELEKVKPYIGIWYEHELSGKVKGAIQNGVDNVGDIPATSFEGGTGIGELGISGKVGKLDVGISGQGYLGVRKGFGGMLKLKYAFGKDAHAKPQPKDK